MSALDKPITVPSDGFRVEVRTDSDGDWVIIYPDYPATAQGAIIEGDGDQMKDLLQAVEQSDSYTAKRCAYQFISSGKLRGSAYLWSPRNSRRAVLLNATQVSTLAVRLRAHMSEAGLLD